MKADDILIFYSDEKRRSLSQADLTIGGVILSGLSSPTQFHIYSGRRILTSASAAGGTLISNAGAAAGLVDLRGTLFGPQTTQQARLLSNLRDQTSPVQLIWGSVKLAVLIKDLHINIVSPNESAYRISCVVANDSIAGIPSSSDILDQSSDAAIGDISRLLSYCSYFMTYSQIAAIQSLLRGGSAISDPESYHVALSFRDFLIAEESQLDDDFSPASLITRGSDPPISSYLYYYQIKSNIVLSICRLSSLLQKATDN